MMRFVFVVSHIRSAVKGTYIPAQRFEGKKLGYFFAKGIHGLGYYMDAAQAVRHDSLHQQLLFL